MSRSYWSSAREILIYGVLPGKPDIFAKKGTFLKINGLKNYHELLKQYS